MFILFFFFKQKTAYEMRISDWSSDVCSSDLLNAACHSRDPFACLDTIRLPYERGCMSDPARADDQTAEPAAQTLQKDEKKNSFLETIRFLLTVAILAVALRSFLFAPFNIPSESMLPRLLVGDYLFVSKWPYGYSRWSFSFGIVPISGDRKSTRL